MPRLINWSWHIFCSNLNETIMILSISTLLVALVLTAVAEYYSIVGLTSIFSGAVIPIIIMGTTLALAKVVTTIWLKLHWTQASVAMKTYLMSAVIVLSLLTSIGIFGFLSRAHAEQNSVSGDNIAKLQTYDQQIAVIQRNITLNNRVLEQMDRTVEQLIVKGDDAKELERAAQLRKTQQRERTALSTSNAQYQAEIDKLLLQRAPLEAQMRQLEADVGPIKYLATMVYGDNPSKNLLESSVRWLIILLVTVFDPLAIMLILAGTQSYRWFNAKKSEPETITEPTEAVIDTPEITVSTHSESIDWTINTLDTVKMVEPVQESTISPVVEWSVDTILELPPEPKLNTHSVPLELVSQSLVNIPMQPEPLDNISTQLPDVDYEELSHHLNEDTTSTTEPVEMLESEFDNALMTPEKYVLSTPITSQIQDFEITAPIELEPTPVLEEVNESVVDDVVIVDGVVVEDPIDDVIETVAPDEIVTPELTDDIQQPDAEELSPTVEQSIAEATSHSEEQLIDIPVQDVVAVIQALQNDVVSGEEIIKSLSNSTTLTLPLEDVITIVDVLEQTKQPTEPPTEQPTQKPNNEPARITLLMEQLLTGQLKSTDLSEYDRLTIENILTERENNR